MDKMQYIYLIAIIAIFAVTSILSQRKQKKRMEQLAESLRAGVKVRTAGGFIGTILAVNEDTVVLELSPDNVRAELLKAAVAPLEQPLNQPAEDEEPTKLEEAPNTPAEDNAESSEPKSDEQ